MAPNLVGDGTTGTVVTQATVVAVGGGSHDEKLTELSNPHIGSRTRLYSFEASAVLPLQQRSVSCRLFGWRCRSVKVGRVRLVKRWSKSKNETKHPHMIIPMGGTKKGFCQISHCLKRRVSKLRSRQPAVTPCQNPEQAVQRRKAQSQHACLAMNHLAYHQPFFLLTPTVLPLLPVVLLCWPRTRRPQ